MINTDVAKYYRDLHSQSMGSVEELLKDNEALSALTVLHNYILDFDRLKSAITSRPESKVLEDAVKEYQFALFALTNGQYRYGFVGLRLFFEMMLATILFSAHEIDFRMWSKDTKDLNWNSIKDESNGVFAINFIKAFNPTFSENAKSYSAIAEKVYRECSEFVHGNAKTHALLPSQLSFHKDIFLSWCQKAESMRMVVVYAFAARYLGHIRVQEQKEIEPVILDVLGHEAYVQDFFSVTSE
jgi:hypothetical protein